MKFSPGARLRLAYNWVHLLRNPLDTQRVFNMSDIGLKEIEKNPQNLAEFEAKMQADSGFEELYQARFLPNISLDHLASFPDGSFARAVHHHYVSNNLTPDFYTSVDEIKTRMTYASELFRRTHDIWHTVLGRGTTIEDELYIQGFAVAQLQDPLAVAICAGGLLNRVLRDPTQVAATFEAMIEGYHVGKKAKLFYGMRWDDYYDQPIGEVRKAVGL